MVAIAQRQNKSLQRYRSRRATGKARKEVNAKLDLLKHQWQVINSVAPEFADVCGYGSGKTFGMSVNILKDVIHYPGIKVGLFAPTFDLMALNNIPSILELFDLYGVPYKFNKGRYIIHVGNGSLIICRSLDSPEKIVGFEVCRSYIDELDTMTKAKGLIAWQKVQARTRQVLLSPDGELVRNRQGCFTTPEGFNVVYQLFVKDVETNPALVAQRELIRAKSTDNRHLPKGYLMGLIASYPERLQQAYINGEFVNLTGGAVYYTFDRLKHDKKHELLTVREIDDFKRETLHIGVDFNIRNMTAIVHRLSQDKKSLHAINEITGLIDTPHLAEAIENLYGDHKLIFYPDCSGSHGNTNNASAESDHAVLGSIGLIRALPKNPRIKNRVAAYNTLIESGRYYVDVDRCPKLVESFEQQIYTPYGLPDKAAGLDHPPDAGGYCVNYLFPVVDRKLKLLTVAH